MTLSNSYLDKYPDQKEYPDEKEYPDAKKYPESRFFSPSDNSTTLKIEKQTGDSITDELKINTNLLKNEINDNNNLDVKPKKIFDNKIHYKKGGIDNFFKSLETKKEGLSKVLIKYGITDFPISNEQIWDIFNKEKKEEKGITDLEINMIFESLYE